MYLKATIHRGNNKFLHCGEEAAVHLTYYTDLHLKLDWQFSIMLS